MTPREIVEATLAFENPPRCAMALPDPHPNDLAHGGRANPPGEPLDPQGNEIKRWRDEWGVVWASLTDFDKGEVVEAALSDWDALDNYQPPELGRQEDYAQAARWFAETDQFRIGHIPGFTFNVARKLRKLDNYLCDLVLDRGRIDELHRRVRGQLLAAIDCLAAADADAIMFPEDWGTQDRLMVSPEMWREIFKPEFRSLAGRAKDHGMRVIMHSCGKMTAVIDDMIECGIDCFQFDQPRLHGIDTLGDRFGGRASFWCPVDIQQTLQTGDAELIRAEAKELVETLGRFGGGFIAGAYPSPRAIGIDEATQDIASRAFVEFGQASA